jgi:hypothetical protein
VRFSILGALLPCALLAQTSPPRPAAQDAFQKLPQRFDWVQASPQPQRGWQAQTFASPSAVVPGWTVAMAAIPAVCSIPLLHAPIPESFSDQMSVPTQAGKDFDPKFILTAPPVCEDRKP